MDKATCVLFDRFGDTPPTSVPGKVTVRTTGSLYWNFTVGNPVGAETVTTAMSGAGVTVTVPLT
jgi:hypothetical protein